MRACCQFCSSLQITSLTLHKCGVCCHKSPGSFRLRIIPQAAITVALSCWDPQFTLLDCSHLYSSEMALIICHHLHSFTACDHSAVIMLYCIVKARLYSIRRDDSFKHLSPLPPPFMTGSRIQNAPLCTQRLQINLTSTLWSEAQSHWGEADFKRSTFVSQSGEQQSQTSHSLSDGHRNNASSNSWCVCSSSQRD